MSHHQRIYNENVPGLGLARSQGYGANSSLFGAQKPLGQAVKKPQDVAVGRAALSNITHANTNRHVEAQQVLKKTVRFPPLRFYLVYSAWVSSVVCLLLHLSCVALFVDDI